MTKRVLRLPSTFLATPYENEREDDDGRAQQPEESRHDGYACEAQDSRGVPIG